MHLGSDSVNSSSCGEFKLTPLSDAFTRLMREAIQAFPDVEGDGDYVARDVQDLYFKGVQDQAVLHEVEGG